MPQGSVELFSIEAFLMQAFALALGIMAAVQFAGFIWTKRFANINECFDRFVEWIHASCEIIPWLFVAAFIAILTPIYDIFLDGAWTSNLSGGAAVDSLLDVWREMVATGGDRNAQRDLVHSIQWLTALSMFYIYSVTWLFSVKKTEGKLSGPAKKLARGAFFGGFSFLISQISMGVSYLGQNADILLFLQA
jgi:hypothetical protein